MEVQYSLQQMKNSLSKEYFLLLVALIVFFILEPFHSISILSTLFNITIAIFSASIITAFFYVK